jgi:NADP-dependent 3-hydroxy acid dehydrogenase YdfG
MDQSLCDRVAIVTGASSGIGKGIAETFARAGARTLLVARSRDKLDGVAKSLAREGATALAAPCDVTREDEVAGLFRRAVETWGRVDVVVNNAGVASSTAIDDLTVAEWNSVLAVNLTAVLLMSREAVRQMKQQSPQGGRIINMGSVSAKTPRADSIAYTATKHAVQGITHQLTLDGRKYGVVASVIHPGATLSGFTAQRGRTSSGPGKTPDDYVMSADDVARVALLMATLPPEVNLYEATILPNTMRSFIGRG